MIRLMHPKELMLIKSMVCVSALFVITGIVIGKVEINFRFDLKVCNGCPNLMQKALCFNDVAFVSVKENNYRIDFWYMSKEKDIKVLQNPDFAEKKEHYIA